jgi:hypothetical protein
VTKKRKKPKADPLASVPPDTRQEIERHFLALTEQVETQRAEAKEWEALKPYLDQAKVASKTLPEVLQDFVTTETTLREKPVDGMFALCDALGLDPVETARALVKAELGLARVLNSKIPKSDKSDLGCEGEQAPPASFDATSLLPKIDAALERRRQEQDAVKQIDAFKHEHPRFSELEKVIAGLLEQDIAENLPDAYAKAELLKPASPQPDAPAQEQAAVQIRERMPAVQPAPIPPQAAQPRKAKLSITGSPATGSDPATRKVPATTRDAVEKAFAQLGL